MEFRFSIHFVRCSKKNWCNIMGIHYSRLVHEMPQKCIDNFIARLEIIVLLGNLAPKIYHEMNEILFYGCIPTPLARNHYHFECFALHSSVVLQWNFIQWLCYRMDTKIENGRRIWCLTLWTNVLLISINPDWLIREMII